MANLYGVHDEEGAHLVPDGGWCVALTKLLDQPAGKGYNSRLNWLVRLNWGYGSEGTVPHLHNMRQYLDSLLRFVSGSSGVYGYIIGNEPNHENERPSGIYIEPEHYAEFYYQAYSAIKSFNPNLRIIVAAPAPYHANGYTWVEYYMAKLAAIAKKGLTPDGFAIHAYARSQQPDAIYSVAQMEGRLAGTFAGFFTYRDALACIPATWRHVPSYLTEFNPVSGWEDRNTGIVKRFYQELDWWNHQPDTTKILCGALYRYPAYDKWNFNDKPGVIEDLRNAIQLNLLSPSLHSPQKPQEGPGATKEGLLMPSIKKGVKNAPSPSPAFKRHIDERAVQRGVNIFSETNNPTWKVRTITWFDKEQAKRIGPDHHILIDVQDEQGQRIPGIDVKVMWPTGFHTVTTKANLGHVWATDYPMSPSRNEFSVTVVGNTSDSEVVRGIGMGADLGSGFNAGEHTSTLVVFQRVMQVQESPSPSQEETKPVQHTINLVHPVKDAQYRRITQRFGENPDFYRKFIYEGVPLQGHNGIDYGTPVGTPIQAVDAGRIVESANDADGWGEYVKILHSWGESLYAHLSKRIFEAGETVMKGQPIALSGDTGISTGPHLHFGMRIFPYKRNDGWGGFANPLPWLETKPEVSTNYTEVINILKQVAQEQNLDWRLLAALAWNESSFKTGIQYGLMQVEDAAWQDFSPRVGATDRKNPLHNARVGAAYFKFLLERYAGNVWKAVVAYNMGYPAYDGGNPVPELTNIHAAKVVSCYDFVKAVGV